MARTGLSRFGRFLTILAVCGLVLAGSSTAWAADFPQKGKAIQVLVGFAAGGSSDAGARILASGLEKEARHARCGGQQTGGQWTDRIHGTGPGQARRLHHREHQFSVIHYFVSRSVPGKRLTAARVSRSWPCT